MFDLVDFEIVLVQVHVESGPANRVADGRGEIDVRRLVAVTVGPGLAQSFHALPLEGRLVTAAQPLLQAAVDEPERIFPDAPAALFGQGERLFVLLDVTPLLELLDEGFIADAVVEDALPLVDVAEPFQGLFHVAAGVYENLAEQAEQLFQAVFDVVGPWYPFGVLYFDHLRPPPFRRTNSLSTVCRASGRTVTAPPGPAVTAPFRRFPTRGATALPARLLPRSIIPPYRILRVDRPMIARMPAMIQNRITTFVSARPRYWKA